MNARYVTMGALAKFAKPSDRTKYFVGLQRKKATNKTAARDVARNFWLVEAHLSLANRAQIPDLALRSCILSNCLNTMNSELVNCSYENILI
jgi:hypothetical protein